MTKFIFSVKPDDDDVEYVDRSGELDFPILGATVNYVVEGDAIQLTIDDQWFEKDDIDYLIDFLNSAKEILK